MATPLFEGIAFTFSTCCCKAGLAVVARQTIGEFIKVSRVSFTVKVPG